MKNKLFVFLLIAFVAFFIVCESRSEASPAKKQTVRIVTPPMGTGAYYLGFKLAEIINKTHPWLQMEAVEGMGSATNVMVMMKDPSLRKNTVFNSTNLSADFARQALPPFKTTYKDALGSDIMAIFGQYNMLCPFITLDPNIKTISDLAGKKVVLVSKGMAAGYVNQYILEKHGLWDKIKPQYMGYKPSATALGDGLVDAVVCMVTMPAKGTYSAIGAFTELLTTKDVYMVHGGDRETILEVAREKKVEVVPVSLAGKFDGRDLPQPMTTFYQGVEWCVDETMDEAIVYEVAKMLYENIDAIRATHPSMKVIRADKLANVSLEERFHKGAAKFYNEVGVKMGFQGID